MLYNRFIFKIVTTSPFNVSPDFNQCEKADVKSLFCTRVTTRRHDPIVFGFKHAAKLPPCSKQYNASKSMLAVIDHGRYFCMSIPTIKRHDLGGYKKFITFILLWRYKISMFIMTAR